jgi:DNA-binding Lrp family transcriptional regulator
VSEPRELPSVLSGFTPAPDALIQKYSFVTALVWGKVWRYCQMSDGVCRAKLETIANELGMSERTIMRHIDPLVEDGFLKDMTPELRNRPHIYADTGKIRIRISVEATMTESHSRVTESHPEGDRESHEESIKKAIKELNINTQALDLFKGCFGKFRSVKELVCWNDLFGEVGWERAEQLTEWALKKEIHLENRSGLLDSLKTASKNWREKPARTNGKTKTDLTALVEEYAQELANEQA